MVRPWPCSVAPAAIIAPPAGCLNAIKASHPRAVSLSLIQRTQLPGVSYTPVPNQSMAARSHKGRSEVLHNEIVPFRLEAWQLLMPTRRRENSTCDFGSAMLGAVLASLACGVASWPRSGSRRFAGSFARASNSRDSDTLPLRAGSDTLPCAPAYQGVTDVRRLQKEAPSTPLRLDGEDVTF
jgi:hypothetical protein